ncbi:LysE family translocator [Pseudovibrio sp. Tun.PSC04-5.I4]|uniref:LysE family translocator n=1 Tax=Pseudovibrio sp. Tun.PSC04-5.I4 TaxID=1798213 RepID=UPI000882FA96|nr:LysE family translocator [Pseudovibrio sp. Tun.PSC04-5.I4]SDR10499.1 Threonine/homoserine/homoserine lactone efflux protein [Pseudovibrio sp. Tun.PSC04-5.I4]
MDFHYWIIFFATVLGVSFIPGPSTLVAFAHGATFGWTKSAYTALGNSTASVLQASAASAGLGLVISSSALLFSAIKYAGAVYLIYIGFQMWRSASERVALSSESGNQRGNPRKLFVDGFTVAVSNPKAIAFFTALFPQFLSVHGNSWAQLSMMVALVGIGAFSVALTYGCLGAWVRGLKFSKIFMSRLYKTTGGLFVASGFGLAVSRNG